MYICYILGGGEPLCRLDLIYELVETIKCYNIKGMITTNGTIFPEDLAIKMVNLHWDFIHFSIDGPDADTHDELRGVKGSFSKAIEAIQLLNYWKEKLFIDKPSIEFNTVLSAKNYHTLPRIFELAKKFSISHVTVIPMIMHSKKMQQLDLSRIPSDVLIKYLKEAKSTAERLNIISNIGELIEDYFNLSNSGSESTIQVISFGQANKSNCSGDRIVRRDTGPFDSINCLKPWYHIVIRANGDIGPCCNFQESECNILHESLQTIWFCNYFNKLREYMIKNQPPANCFKCGSTLQSNENKLLVRKLKNLIG